MRREIFAIGITFLAACSQNDAQVGSGFQAVLDVPPEPIEAVDILFVIDNSGSMLAQQEALIASAGEALFAQLAAEVGGMPDLHVAFVSTDLGVGPHVISGCWSEDGDGDKGRFQIGSIDCGVDGNFLTDLDDGAGGRVRNFDGEIADAFACAAALGTTGCGFEQPLESMRRALDGSNPENDDFLRDEAMLLVVILADEDDCSTADLAMLDPYQNDIDGPLGMFNSFRCFEFGVVCDGDDPRAFGDKSGCLPREDSAYMHPVATYIEFLQNLKSDPAMIMFAGIFGDVGPVRVVQEPGQPQDIRPFLDDICGGDADANPAVRMHAVAAGFPARWIFAPICDVDGTVTMEANLRRISRSLGGVLAAKSCLLGNVPARPTCRAFAAPPGGARRPVPVTIAPDPEQCGYTVHALAAQVPPGVLVDGEHLIVECLIAE